MKRLGAVLASPRSTLALLGAAAVVALALLLRVPAMVALAQAVPAGGLMPCPWRALTHVPCPGCGGTRALLRLAALDLPGAFAANQLVTAAALGTVLLGLLAVIAPQAADVFLARGGRLLITRRGRLVLAAVLLAQMVLAAGLRAGR
jgi:hypothetical protein